MYTISNLLSSIADSLELTNTQFDNITTSYEAVAEWLNKGEEIIKYGKIRIFPQGSIGLGTVVKPLHGDEYDVDMVLLIDNKDIEASTLKIMVGKRLKENSIYRNMLDDEGRRCWTLIYADSLSYHMDILPTKEESNPIYYKDSPSISATDKDKLTGMYTFKSTNPKGYLKWFFEQSQIGISQRKTFSIDKIKEYPRKTNLQKIVQLLKRHRDVYFDSQGIEDDIPISIIITTLAAKCYSHGKSLEDEFISVVKNLKSGIEKINDQYWVCNPIDEKENFAEKWNQNNNKAKYFDRWLNKLESDLTTLNNSKFIETSKVLCDMFGENPTKEIFESIADKTYLERAAGNLKIDPKTGILNTSAGEKVKGHTFYGEN